MEDTKHNLILTQIAPLVKQSSRHRREGSTILFRTLPRTSAGSQRPDPISTTRNSNIPTTNAASHDSRGNIGALVGGIVAALVVLLFMVSATRFFYSRKRRKDRMTNAAEKKDEKPVHDWIKAELETNARHEMPDHQESPIELPEGDPLEGASWTPIIPPMRCPYHFE